MKKLALLFSIFTFLLINAQKRSQEISIDIADALIMKTLEVNYEFYINDQSSVGISGLFNFSKANIKFRYNEDRMITPFFRHYFTNHRNWNYFGEIFTGINSTNYYTDLALGIGAGLKYISDGGFVVSINGGAGRNMFTDNAPVIVPRVGANIGYRF